MGVAGFCNPKGKLQFSTRAAHTVPAGSGEGSAVSGAVLGDRWLDKYCFLSFLRLSSGRRCLGCI